MDVITSAVFSGILYDMLKQSAKISANNLKYWLKDWALSQNKAEKIEHELSHLNINAQMSEKDIELELLSNKKIQELIASIQPSNQTRISQVHNGNGNNNVTINNS